MLISPIIALLALRGDDLKRYNEIRELRRMIDPGGGIAVTLNGGPRRGSCVRNKPTQTVQREYKPPVVLRYLFSTSTGEENQ